MKQTAICLTLGIFLISACLPVPPKEGLPVPTHSLVPYKTQPATESRPTATSIPCDPRLVEFCIVEGSFIFQNPLGVDSPLKIASSYPYGSTENGKRDPHRGVDLESREGAPVYAAASGRVIFAGRDHERVYTPWDDYYGNLIVLQHENGFFTFYGHLSQIDIVVGGIVKSGELIARVGHTGVAIGGHLHFEIRTGGDASDFNSTENPGLWLPLQKGMGALSISLAGHGEGKIQRSFIIMRYAAGTNVSEKKYYVSTYPKGFEHNEEDFALSNLPPGRYRIAFNDETGLHERIVTVEEGKLTQVIIELE